MTIKQTSASLLHDCGYLLNLLPELKPEILSDTLQQQKALPSLIAHYFRTAERQGAGPFDHPTMQLGSLLEDIRIVHTAGVPGVLDRVRPLVTAEWDLFQSIEYELRVAAGLVSHHHRIEFVSPIDHAKTHDLWLHLGDTPVAVECKRKRHLTPAEDRSLAAWERIQATIIKHWSESEPAIHLTIISEDYLTEETLPDLLAVVRGALKGKNVGNVEIRPGLSLKVVRLGNSNNRASSAQLHWPDAEVYDHAFQLAKKMRRAGKAAVGIPSRFAFRCKAYDLHMGKKTDGVLKTLRSASEQLPRSFPAIIYLDLNGIERQLLGPQRKDLSNQLAGWVGRHPEISAVIATSHEFIRKKGQTSYLMPAFPFVNSHAKFALPIEIGIENLWGRPGLELGESDDLTLRERSPGPST